jgi:hypothetical protein
MTAPAIDRARLARVLGLLGSQHDGEALAAARMAERLRRTAGLTWADIVVGVSQRAPAAADDDDDDFDLYAALDACFARLWLLSDWEQAFVRSIHHQRRCLCPKQKAVLERLYAKARGGKP